ncbi:MAG TPA: M90 family metallopeptidase [Candidatus Bathyarchaeia archaeon]|nr:M90 family metallopeptidase [Candidatus Bathyarchaeia archaeon]
MFETKKKRRARLMKTPLRPDWIAIVERTVPYYLVLPPADREELLGLVQVFLAEKRFEGCDGLEITDEIRLTIAVQACVLLLHRKTDVYPLLQSILVYPHTFVAPLKERAPGGVVIEDFEEREGESWDTGALVLSWDDVLESAADVHDGYNVVLHEFAHQLDDESGIADGAPRLESKAAYEAWSRVFEREYDALVENIERHRPTLLDEYAVESPAEFFAVVTEAFFETPAGLKAAHPELYEQLSLYYRQDPASFAAERDARDATDTR